MMHDACSTHCQDSYRRRETFMSPRQPASGIFGIPVPIYITLPGHKPPEAMNMLPVQQILAWLHGACQEHHSLKCLAGVSPVHTQPLQGHRSSMISWGSPTPSPHTPCHHNLCSACVLHAYSSGLLVAVRGHGSVWQSDTLLHCGIGLL